MTQASTGCRETFDVQGYLDQQLTLPERIRFERHLKDCPDCARKVARMEKLFQHLEQSCAPTAEDRVAPETLRRVMGRLGKTPVAPVQEEGGNLFDLLNELRRLQKTLLAGFAVCAVLVLLVVGAQMRSVTVVAPGPDGTIQIERFACSLLTNDGIRKLGGSGETLESPRFIEPSVSYELGPKSRLQVSPTTAHRLEFLAAARFSVTRSGVVLDAGEVVCDLDKVPGFMVTTPHGTVVTVGTMFRVSVRPEGSLVTLERGEIVVKTTNHTSKLQAPTQVRLDANGTIAMLTDAAAMPSGAVVASTTQHLTGAVEPVPGVTSVQATSPVKDEPAASSTEIPVLPDAGYQPASEAENINSAY